MQDSSFNPRQKLVKLFLESCCFAVSGLSTKFDEIFDAYIDWSIKSGIKKLKKKDFLSILKEFCVVTDNGLCVRTQLKQEFSWEFTCREEVRHVYLIFDGKRVKIGLSQDPESRLKTIKTSNPDAFIIGTIQGDFDVETRIQNHFKAKHHAGEWYNLNNEDVKMILEGKI